MLQKKKSKIFDEAKTDVFFNTILLLKNDELL